MKKYLIPALGATLAFFLQACDKPVDVKPVVKCKLVGFRQLENVDTRQPGSGTTFFSYEFVYEGDKLSRINRKTRGEADGYRTITYSGNLPVSEEFRDANNTVTCTYKFWYESNTTKVSHIDVEIFIGGNMFQERNEFHYNAQGKVDTLTFYSLGRKSLLLAYDYTPLSSGGEKIIVTHIQLSPSDPTWRLPASIYEYEFDDKKSPGIWPIYTCDQLNGMRLDLTIPNTGHNIRSYTVKSINYSASDIPNKKYVYDVDLGVSYTAALTYNDNGYMIKHLETRQNLPFFPVSAIYEMDCQ